MSQYGNVVRLFFSTVYLRAGPPHRLCSVKLKSGHVDESMPAGVADLGVHLVRGHFASSAWSLAGAERSYSSRTPEWALR